MKISIVIPVYNKAPYLEKCLESVVNQTYKNLEIIIINDGSTDHSLEICEKYAKEDDRINLISQENKGASAARNKGIETAKGEWIYFLDADDYLELNLFQTIIDKIKQYPDTDIIHFGIRARNVDNKILREKCPSNFEYLTSLKDFYTCLELRPVSCCLYLIKREIIQYNNVLFDVEQKTGEDKIYIYEVFMRSNNFMILDNIFYNQILSPNSLTRAKISKKNVLSNLKSQNKIIKITKNLNKLKPMESEINRGLRSFYGGLLQYILENDIDKEIEMNYLKFLKENEGVFTGVLSIVSKFDLKTIMFFYKTYNRLLKFLKIR